MTGDSGYIINNIIIMPLEFSCVGQKTENIQKTWTQNDTDSDTNTDANMDVETPATEHTARPCVV